MATSRHLWVGGLPDGMKEEDIRDYFTKFVELVRLLHSLIIGLLLDMER